MNNYKKIAIIGLGYIGLPTATLFAARGLDVVGVDINRHAVDTINQGKIHIMEPELDMLVHAVVTQGKLRATTQPETADAFLIAVPTPFKENHKPDLSYIESAAKSIAPLLKKGDLVVLESTSPVGTTEQLAQWLASARVDLSFPQQASESADVQVAYCPERVLPGHVLRELVTNDRVIGGMTKKASEMSVALYKTFVEGECIVTSARTAEMCKLTENSFRDVNIAFANELSIICDKLHINVWELITLANRHPRVNILQPGAGVGGHCIAVDPWFIIDKTPDEAKLIRAAREINDGKPGWVINKVKEAVACAGRAPKDLTIAIMGLAFKPNIDDLRESPALFIAESLANKVDANFLIVEPNIDELPASLHSYSLVGLEEAAMQADIIVYLVAHKQFFAIATEYSTHKVVIDAVGLLKS